MSGQTTVLHAPRDLRGSSASERFHGAAFDVDVSFFINHSPPGHLTAPHRHPYPEVFVLHRGTGVFTVDGEELVARGGDVVIVPAAAEHGFRNDAEAALEMISIHPVAEMQTEWSR